MVKFGRKFFFDKKHKKKNKYTVPIVIVATIIIVAAISTAIFVTLYNKNKNKKPNNETIIPKVVLNKEVEAEVYTEIPEINKYFKKLENIQINDFEIIYPEDLEIVIDETECDYEEDESCKKRIVTTVGEYKITLQSKKLEKENTVTLKVVDTTSPVLTLKDVTITEGKTYKIEDFIDSCKDNSKLSCTYEYANIDEKGNEIDYSAYTKPGTYDIRIIAKDEFDNYSGILSTTLKINKKKTNTCKYGNLNYSNSYIIAVKVDNKECAISGDEANDLSNKAAIKFNKVLAKEIQDAYLEKELTSRNLEGKININITYGVVPNKANTGIVGYYLSAEATQTVNGITTTIARYYINEDGNRVWKINTLNLN